jgi:hypothetical protein
MTTNVPKVASVLTSSKDIRPSPKRGAFGKGVTPRGGPSLDLATLRRRGWAQLLGYVDAQYTALGMQREPTEQWGCDKLMAALRETLSADEITQLAAEGAEWSEDQAVDEALKA